MATAEQMAALKAVVPAAQASQRKYGVPASISLAQWIFESSWGTSKLALTTHNYFGIKAEHLGNPATYVEFVTHEYVNGKLALKPAKFEKYFDAADSFDDHGHLLASALRYRPAMAVAALPNIFAFWLQKAGYSTAPDYSLKLIGAMRDYSLYQYDAPPADPAKAQEVAA